MQNLKQAIESRLQRLLQQNPLRTNFQQHYEEIIAGYNREKYRYSAIYTGPIRPCRRPTMRRQRRKIQLRQRPLPGPAPT